MRAALPLFLLALALRALGALGAWPPPDWDPAYYADVARHLAAGDGAVTSAAWTLAGLPDRLPAPADLHWMPLPSRLLAPFALAWPERGAQLGAAVLGAAWAPLAWAVARRLGAREGEAVAAGLFAAFAGGYAPFLSVPDSVAPFGVVGGLALGFAAGGDGRRGWGAAAALGALAALTRGDGVLLAPCLALGWRGWRALAVALSGPVAAAAWAARSWLAGDGAWVELRRVAANAATQGDLLLGDAAPLGLAERLALAARALPGALLALLVGGAVLLPLLAVPGAFLRRRDPAVRAGAAWLAVLLVAPLVAAPAVGASGTPFRSASALFPLAAALAALALGHADAWLARRRAWRSGALTAIVLAGFGVASLLLLARARALQPPAEDACAELPPGPGFAADPLAVAVACGREAVVLPRGADPARLADAAGRLGLRWALAARPDDPRAEIAHPEDVPALLPGWVRAGGRLWRAP